MDAAVQERKKYRTRGGFDEEGVVGGGREELRGMRVGAVLD